MAKQQPVKFTQVHVTDGFWKQRQKLNANITIRAVQKRFEDTGRFSAYYGHWREGTEHKPQLYWTGDIEKWIESVGYLIATGHCSDLEPICDQIAAYIEQNQWPDGYYNMWIQQIEPDKRWSNRDWHELYAAGHLMEAAVAYYEATGKDTLLRCACRIADHIEQVFVIEHSAAFTTPGHEEIELALVRLYRCTGELRYLALSKFFVDERGQHGEEKIPADYSRFTWCNGRYDQTHAPVREQNTAEGHAVRAVYLYCAMADLAYEYGDDSLKAACERLFDNITQRRMYITGGIGSTRRCEGFTIDYDLPNLTAYTETCAGIGLMMFARRMSLLTPEAKYADVIERVLYNGFLSSTSLDGKSFFYENPLEIDPKLIGRETFALESTRMPITQRVEVFDCSCCPPNITRLVASLGDYLYTYTDDTLFVHQFVDSETQVKNGGTAFTVIQRTAYPSDGTVQLQIKGGSICAVAVRIPGWCARWSATVDGQPVPYSFRQGYAHFKCPARALTLHFDMTPFAIEASPHVQNNAGRIAIQRGPVVYCLEGVDNGIDLRDVHIDLNQPITAEDSDWCGLPVLHAVGWRRDPIAFGDALYRRAADARQVQPLTFIPYYSFANRGETEMIVWIAP